jgi:ketosteroid isomerase-like protein
MTAEEIVREGYERYARGDFSGVFALLSPEIEITQTTELPPRALANARSEQTRG